MFMVMVFEAGWVSCLHCSRCLNWISSLKICSIAGFMIQKEKKCLYKLNIIANEYLGNRSDDNICQGNCFTGVKCNLK